MIEKQIEANNFVQEIGILQTKFYGIGLKHNPR